MKKRHSKRSKNDWRKHSDIKDVEEYLEGRRREEKFGVPACEKPDSELFFVHKDRRDVEMSASVKLTRKKFRQMPLRSELNQQPNPAIKGFPVIRRKAPKKRKDTIHDLPITRADSSCDEGDLAKSASYQSIRRSCEEKLISRKKECPNKDTTYVATKDLWSEEMMKDKVDDEHYLKVARKSTIKKPRSMMEIPSLLKSVELPHPGMSYNPSFSHHQDLLREAVRVEEDKLKETEKLQRKLQLARMTHTEREKVWLEEMSEGIKGGGGEEEVEEICEGELPIKRPIRAEERKTRRQRKKEMLRKREELVKRQLKARRMKMDEIYRLRSIKKEISVSEAAIAKKESQSSELKRQEGYLTKRLGKHQYVEPTIPVQLSSELTGSLRALKTVGNLALDRYKSLQKRNIIEPRQLVRRRRKYKLLVKEKWSAKLPEDKN